MPRKTRKPIGKKTKGVPDITNMSSLLPSTPYTPSTVRVAKGPTAAQVNQMLSQPLPGRYSVMPTPKKKSKVKPRRR